MSERMIRALALTNPVLWVGVVLAVALAPLVAMCLIFLWFVADELELTDKRLHEWTPRPTPVDPPTLKPSDKWPPSGTPDIQPAPLEGSVQPATVEAAPNAKSLENQGFLGQEGVGAPSTLKPLHKRAPRRTPKEPQIPYGWDSVATPKAPKKPSKSAQNAPKPKVRAPKRSKKQADSTEFDTTSRSNCL